MKHFLLDRQLKKIERECNDDLLMVLEAGPQYYTNHELYLLLDELSYQEQTVLSYNKRLFLALTSIFLWIGLFFFSNAFDLFLLSKIFLALIPLALLYFIIGSIRIRRNFPTHKNGYLIRTIIQQELERRRKDASIS